MSERREPLTEDVFNRALELPESARAEYLDRACGHDTHLRRDVEELLAIVEEDPHLLEIPASPDIPERLGKYELEEEISRGVMGIVYRATDTELHRTVALKILPDTLARDGAGLARFRREARLLASLNHENVATLHTLDHAEDLHYLTLEFVEGRTLAHHLDEGVPPRNVALDWISQVARGLAAAHEKGIVHRDLKPANIMITGEGCAKILDFGIAKSVEGGHDEVATRELRIGRTTSIGTPGYISPEQRTGLPVDGRSDIWALGCVLFECLYGRAAPGSAGTDSHGPKPMVPDRSGGGKVPRALRALLESCLAENPDERPRSVTEVLAVIERVRRARRASLRRRAVAILALAVSLPLLLIGLQPSPEVPPIGQIQLVGLHSVCALAGDGEMIWTRELPGRVERPRARRTREAPTIVTRGDEQLGVVVATTSGVAPPTLWLLAPDDGSTIWKRSVSWHPPVNMSSHLFVDWTATMAWPGLLEPAILLGLRDGPWYSFAVRVVSLDGDSLATYYHPDPLWLPALHELDQREDGKLLLFGSNSSARFLRSLVPFETSHHCPSVVLLDPLTMSGQGFPYSEHQPEPRDWPDLARASETAYVVFAPIHPSVPGEVRAVRPSARHDAWIEAECTDGRIFFLDEDLRPLSCFFASRSAADSLGTAGAAYHLPAWHVRNGRVEVVDVPLEAS